MKNGQMWLDTNNNPIQAHGGCILKYNGVFYWYGEHKGIENRPGKTEVDMIGVSCYSSLDLCAWKYEGLVLQADKENKESYLYYKNILERPKVLYNEKTQKFVMWMHLENENRTQPNVGVAVCDTPTGEFTLLSCFRPNWAESRDMTLYKDVDGAAYLFHSSDANRTMCVARLTKDYLKTDGLFVSVLIDQDREAPTICLKNGKYYMVTSGCTGWASNTALYATSPYLMGKWKLIDNPCEGENYRQTFYGQSAFILEDDGKYYMLLDHWMPENLQESGYSILPIEFNVNGDMTIRWKTYWKGIDGKDI